MDLSALSILASPAILFFALGLLAAAARSDLAIPEAFAKAMSIYLMIAIGLKGGVAVAKTGLTAEMGTAALLGVTLSFTLPVLAFFLLRRIAGLNQTNAGAVAAHYGSVSVVTFVTAVELLGARGMAPAGYMVAVLALMETPAILTGLLLARRGMQPDPGVAALPGRGIYHEVFLNASVVLLVGSFVIGAIAGPEKFADIQPVFDTGFKGVLALFLLDMGLLAARRLIESRALRPPLVLLAVALPLINGTIGTIAATLVGLDVGSAATFGVLCASASYIAVPAAMRMALPQADPGIYLAMSLSITFPFNILFGITLFGTLAQALSGG